MIMHSVFCPVCSLGNHKVNLSSAKVPGDPKESKVHLIKNFKGNLVTSAGTLLELSEKGFNGQKSLLPTTSYDFTHEVLY